MHFGPILRPFARKTWDRFIRRLPAEWQYQVLRGVARELDIQGLICLTDHGQAAVPALDPFVSKYTILERGWEKGVLAFLKSELAKGGTLIDVGAHVGLIACPVAAIPGVDVHAFEPNPANFRLLSANRALAGLDDVIHLHQVALADASGTAELLLSSENSGDNRLFPAHSPGRAFVTVERNAIGVTTARLDECLQRSSLRPPVVIKMDVQGAEAAVLSGASWVLDDCETLVMEFWPAGMRALHADPSALIHALCCRFPFVGLIDAQGDGSVTLERSDTSAGSLLRRADSIGGGQFDVVFTRRLTAPPQEPNQGTS